MPWINSRSRRWIPGIAPVVPIFVAVFFAAFVAKAEATVPAGDRAWELVTPAEQTSARTFAVRPMAEDSDKFAYSSFGPFPGSESGPFVSFLTTQRGPTGWTNAPISLPYSVFEMEELVFDLLPIFPGAFSEDLLTTLWLSSVPLTPGAPPEKELGLYRKAPGEALEFIAQIGGEGVTFEFPGFADIARDGGRVIFTSDQHLLPGDAGRTQGRSIYEWDDESLQLVDVDNGGTLLSTCGTQLSPANGMSASADLVFFTVPAACAGVAKVYVRDLEAGTTTQISASQCTRVDCNAPAAASFQGAVRDGSVAFLTTQQQLTNDDHDAGRDLYRYETGTGELSLLSGGAEGATGEVVSALVYPSDNGDRVYFRATGEVLPGEATTGEKLFLADSGGPHLVAQISLPPKPELQLSADGTRALVLTKSSLLGSDTDSETDAYLYDSDQESWTWISSGPSAGNGLFGVTIESPIQRPEFQSTGNDQTFYAIDGSGERVFFWTAEQLVPEDTNTKVSVYEWWNGQVGLISSGDDEFDAGFGGVSRDGRSVLFVTNATLSPADVDGGNRDFYVARLDGGFPETEEPPACNITLCPPPQREQLVRPTPRSAGSFPQRKRHLRVIRVRSKGEGVVGRITVLVSVPHPGLVSASVWVRDGGKKVVLAAGNAGAVRPGKLRIDLSLTRSARQSSAAGARKGHLTVRAGDSMVTQSVKLDLD